MHSQHLGIAGWLNPGALSVGQQGALAERHERREHRCSARAQCSRLVAAAAAGEAPPPAFAEAFRSVMQQVQMGLQGLTQPIPTMGAALTVAELAHHPPGAHRPHKEMLLASSLKVWAHHVAYGSAALHGMGNLFTAGFYGPAVSDD